MQRLIVKVNDCKNHTYRRKLMRRKKQLDEALNTCQEEAESLSDEYLTVEVTSQSDIGNSLTGCDLERKKIVTAKRRSKCIHIRILQYFGKHWVLDWLRISLCLNDIEHLLKLDVVCQNSHLCRHRR